MPGIGIISNPYAKINRTDPEHNTLIWYVLGNSGQFEVTSSLDDLAKVCENFSSRGIDHVGIIGGDGTVSRTLSALMRTYPAENLPRILVLRGGTVNVLATNLGIYGKPKDILADFLDFLHSNNPLHEMPVRSLIVENEIGFLFGSGGAARFLEAFYENKTTAAGAGKFFARILLDGLAGGHLTGEFSNFSAPEHLSIEVVHKNHTKTIEVDTPVFLASSVPKIPYGLEFFPELSSNTNSGQAIYADAQGRRLVGDLVVSLMSKNKSHRNLKKIAFEELRIRSQTPTKYTLDGEIMTSTTDKITIKLGPIFRFCSPYGKILGS